MISSLAMLILVPGTEQVGDDGPYHKRASTAENRRWRLSCHTENWCVRQTGGAGAHTLKSRALTADAQQEQIGNAGQALGEWVRPVTLAPAHKLLQV